MATAVERKLDPAATQVITAALAPCETTRIHGPNEVIFAEGAEATGLYILHSGEADLIFQTKTGVARPLIRALAGDVLGLSCVMSGRPHESTATARSTCITGFVPGDQFRALLQEEPDLWLPVLRLISENVNSCWDCMRALK
jgi:CRP-like cAMP-binding protein